MIHRSPGTRPRPRGHAGRGRADDRPGRVRCIDTREEHEWRAGYLAGATLVPPIDV